MDSREAAPRRGSVTQAFATVAPMGMRVSARSHPVAALSWAAVASTLRRVQRGEGALLAVNLSLIAYQGVFRPLACVETLISLLTIGVMYVLNDLHDAPTDSNNPKKDHALIAIYLEHRRACVVLIVLTKMLTLALAWATLSPRATIAVAGVLGANVAYSMIMKGLPVLDVVWCGLWGALYAAIVTPAPALWLLVGLMTAICHLYQALDDRDADAANAITTTAVRSQRLSAGVLAALCVLLYAALRPPFGPVWAWTAFAPLVIHFSSTGPRTGWLLTKGYFGVMWLTVLGISRAAG
jgi:4-hydroxybenzoate polyprenyltransferase